jgi:hypothetical protein
LIKSFKTILKGSFFRSAVTLGKFISRRVDIFSVSSQFPCPSISTCNKVSVVVTTKVERARIAEIIKLASRVAVVIDSPSLMFHVVFVSAENSPISFGLFLFSGTCHGGAGVLYRIAQFTRGVAKNVISVVIEYSYFISVPQQSLSAFVV